MVVSYEDIQAKNYSLSAGQYFEVKIEYVDITQEEFRNSLGAHQENLRNLFDQSKAIESKIEKSLVGLVLHDD